MKNKKLFNFWIPNDIYEYLKLKSAENYMSMTDYIIQLLLIDKKKEKKNMEQKMFFKIKI